MINKDLLEEFEKITDELIAIDIDGDIDSIIEKINEKLSRRDFILEKFFSDKRSDEENEISLRIMQKNDQLKTKFEEIKLSISDNISDVVKEKKLSSTKKKAHRGYLNPGRQNDGYFIDKKK